MILGGQIRVSKSLIADVHAGKVHSRIAARLAPRMNLQLRD
jgi:hypothetical protein